MSAQRCPKCGNMRFSQAGYDRHVANCTAEEPTTRNVKIDFDNNPLTRVVEQARRECPDLQQALVDELGQFKTVATADGASNLLYLAVALVCKEQSCTPREAILGMQRRLTQLDNRARVWGTLLRAWTTAEEE